MRFWKDIISVDTGNLIQYNNTFNNESNYTYDSLNGGTIGLIVYLVLSNIF
jgi:hypothetical protein